MTELPFKSRLKPAIFYSTLSSLSFASMLAASKASLTTCSLNQISFFKGGFSWILITFFLLLRKGIKGFIPYLKTEEFGIHTIRGFSGLFTIYLFLLALKTIPLAEANLLFNTTPLFVPLIAYFWKKSPIDHRIWPGLVIAFLGMSFLLHPEEGVFNSGFWIALSAGALGAVTVIVVRFSHASEPVSRTIFYYSSFSFFFSGLFYSFEGFSLSFLRDLPSILVLSGIGIASFCCQIFFTLAIKYAPARLIAPFFYIAVIFGLAFDFFFWDVLILPPQILGIGLVIAGLCFISFLFQEKTAT